jgi:hypothetical protein
MGPIERCDQVVKAPASYYGDSGFKYWPGDQLSRGFWCFFSFPPRECRDSTLKLGQDRFLPNHFQFMIHS